MPEEQYSDEVLRKQIEELRKQQKEQPKKTASGNETDWTEELESARRLEASAEQLLLESRSKPGGAFVGMDLYTQVVLRYITGLIAKLGLDIAKLQNDINELKRR